MAEVEKTLDQVELQATEDEAKLSIFRGKVIIIVQAVIAVAVLGVILVLVALGKYGLIPTEVWLVAGAALAPFIGSIAFKK